MSSTTMTVSLSAEEKALISACADQLGVSSSEFMRAVVLDFIEDELAAQDGAGEEPGPFEVIARRYL